MFKFEMKREDFEHMMKLVLDNTSVHPIYPSYQFINAAIEHIREVHTKDGVTLGVMFFIWLSNILHSYRKIWVENQDKDLNAEAFLAIFRDKLSPK